MQPFLLVREIDVSGVSGTGVVAEGVLFSNGKVVLAWQTTYQSVATYDSLADCARIHAHGGASRIEFVQAGINQPCVPENWLSTWDDAA